MILASRPTSKNEKVASIWDANANANVVNTKVEPPITDHDPITNM